MASSGAWPSTSSSSSPSRCSRRPRPIERVQANAFVTPDFAARRQEFRRSGASVVTVGELHGTVVALSRRDADDALPRELSPPRAARRIEPASRGRHPHAALRRAPARLGDRRRLLAPRPVPDAAAAQPVDQGGDAAPRRCLGGDPVQPRPAADRARQCPPGRQRVRQGARLRPGTAPSAISGSCRPRWCGSASASTRSSATSPSAAPTGRATSTTWSPSGCSATSPPSSRSRRGCTPPAMVIEIRPNPMPDGGVVTTYTDITDRVAAAEELARANESLEQRVRERTEELDAAQRGAGRAKAEADEANISKTRFLAAASHDILQPLNAARLYATTLVERSDGGRRRRGSPRNVDASLDAVEEILGALLDISRLDAGAMRPEMIELPRSTSCCASSQVEFEPMAREKGLELRFVAVARARSARTAGCCAAFSRTSSRTPSSTRPAGRVLVGCRRRGGRDVVDGRRGHRARHPEIEAAHRLQGVPAPRAGREGRARPRPRPVDRRAHRARARPPPRPAVGAGPRNGLLRRGAGGRRSRRAAPRRPRARASRRPPSTASSSSQSTTSRRSSTAWRRC